MSITYLEERANGITEQSVSARLLTDGFIFVEGKFDDDMLRKFTREFLFLREKNIPIKLVINSPGGSVDIGLTMIDLIKSTNDIEGIVIGTAASMGALLISSLPKGKRYATANSKLLIHNPSITQIANANSLEIQELATNISSINKMLNKLLAQNTGKSEKFIKNICNREKFMTACEAVDVGLIDQVTTVLSFLN